MTKQRFGTDEASPAEDPFLGRVVAWAGQHPQVRALVLTGSRARDDGSVDEVSDYDLELFTTDRAALEESNAWLEEFGHVWVCLPTTRSEDGRYRTRLTVYENGLKADFSVAPVALLEDFVQRERLNDLYDRGYRVLVDKDGLREGARRVAHRDEDVRMG